MIRERKIQVSNLCCVACFKQDQEELLERGIMLSLGTDIKCSVCNKPNCKKAERHEEECELS